ncbi:histone deacetylase family protein [Aquipseudomonas alcaligenes]|uniref:Acetoin utilization deacetylase AcuC n=1 Tax=Aquipseudomonas alcaligenes TaxID=43263 RepID=A0A1N6NIK8_AQUAC|nr:histone deacetylase family protein [Pseudomonas alcaligenes]SIP91910.1 Acetoin utilization deacetylase AcuC [Pseudomonas alcaligenes]
MLTFYSDDHRLHHAQGEMVGGEFKPCFEMPARADHVLARVRERDIGEVLAPRDFGLAPIARIHTADYLDFLQQAWAGWAAQGNTADFLPGVFPARHMRAKRPNDLYGQYGFHSFDCFAPITTGTWQAVYTSAQVALSGQAEIAAGAHSAFALCRPPGHHASADVMGGYCYLNNVAIVAQACLDQGAARVAILDVDYHHGNGTQSIFYDRDDVFVANIHGSPSFEYPHFLGYADETGAGRGEGFNLNLPLAAGSAWDVWGAALETACQRIAAYGPDVVLVSLGVDTYQNDPISSFKLDSPDYLRMGERIAALGKPTLFVMEGGYAVAEIGINAVNVLEGFQGA